MFAEATNTPDPGSDIEFLESYLASMKSTFLIYQELGPSDLRPGDPLSVCDDSERCARLADKHGIDGNVFRDGWDLRSHECSFDFNMSVRLARRQIALIPRIIAAIENPSEKAARNSQSFRRIDSCCTHGGPARDAIKKEPKRRGRPRVYDEQKDAKLAEDWVSARGVGSSKELFCRERGITKKELDATLSRVRSREYRKK